MLRERLVRAIEFLAPTPVAWLAIAMGVLVHWVGFFLFRIEVPSVSQFQNPMPFVSFVELDRLSEHQIEWNRALLSDSLPLFLPSPVDYSWELLQPGYYIEEHNARILEPFEETVIPDVEGLLAGLWKGEVPELTDLLHPDILRLFRTLGEGRVTTPDLGARFGVFQFRDEALQISIREVPVMEQPSPYWGRGILWKPCEMMVFVGAEGCIGDPLLRESSGLTVIDQFALRWVRDFTNRLEVPPGYYRVVFGP